MPFLGYLPLSAQNCPSNVYQTAIYDSVQVVADLSYGTAISYNFDTTDLLLDFYEPYGDTSSLRPLIVWIHGGGFYAGNKGAGEIVGLCDSFARKGFVTASISYRLGFWGANDAILTAKRQPPYCFDNREIVRAIYRAAQDAKGAIRYLKDEASTFRIDTNRVFVGGVSAGAFTALHVAYLDQEYEKPVAADSLNPVIHTDLFGGVILNKERPDLGPVSGTLNQNGHSARVAGCINIYGALIDTSLIESAYDVPLFNYHILDDPLVSCFINKPFHGTAILGTLHPVVYGACMIRGRLDSLGMAAQCQESHIRPSDIFGNPPRVPHSYTTDREYFYRELSEFMIQQVCERPAIVSQPQSQQVALGASATFEVIANSDSATFQWYFNGNLLVGKTDSILTISSVQYADTGLYRCLVLNGCGPQAFSDEAQLSIGSTTAINETEQSEVFAYPNPSDGLVYLTAPDTRIISATLFSLQGKRLIQFSTPTSLDLRAFPKGVYLLAMETDRGMYRQKLLLR